MTLSVSTPAASSAVLTSEVTVTPVSAGQAARAALAPGQWTTDDFCAYVLEEMTRIHGDQLPSADPRAILAAFCERHRTEDAVRIARAVFERHGGMWQGAPVTIRRFTAAHDEFFAEALLASC